VEVLNNALGKPELHLKNKAKETVDKQGITNIQLSISHGRDMAAAFVILEI
jgi:holo-[acyl-carrier protein] synthase